MPLDPQAGSASVPGDPAAALSAACVSLGLGVSTEVQQRLLAFLDQLLRWNRVYNLTAIREPGQALTQHLVDCLAVLKPLESRWRERQTSADEQPALLDVGSGGGLPGVVLAIAKPHWRVTCIDTVAKKAGFVRQVAAELSLPNLCAVHARVESASFGDTGFDFIISRAFASLDDFVRLTRPHLKAGGEWVAMKGQRPTDEIAQLVPTVEVFHVEPLAVPGLQAQRCLVWMRAAAESATP